MESVAVGDVFTNNLFMSTSNIPDTAIEWAAKTAQKQPYGYANDGVLLMIKDS